MSTTNNPSTIEEEGTAPTTVPETPKLVVHVKIEAPQACLRHVIVTIPRVEVNRYLEETYNKIVPTANVPGFRAGRAPRKLVERHFRERVEDQVKGMLISDSLAQVSEEQDFSAISEPTFDFEAISLPSSGDFTYEFSVEVRPQFETPQWRGVPLIRQDESISEKDIDKGVQQVLAKYSIMQATDEPAQIGDTLVLDIETFHNERSLVRLEEVRVLLRPAVSFIDGRCTNFGEILTGSREGDTVKGKINVFPDVSDEALRGTEIDATFTITEVQRSELPPLTNTFLKNLGDFASEDELRLFIKDTLARRAEFRQREDLRRQVVINLTANAKWDLPPTLVRKQARRELERKALELRRSGFSDEYINQVLNLMRSNATAATEQALREHFILEQIAEDEKIEATPEDFDQEIDLIAEQSDMAARRVRTRLEKSGQMDALRNQIVERKVVDLIVERATVTEHPMSYQGQDEEQEYALNESVIAMKDLESIPEAKYDDRKKGEARIPGSGPDEPKEFKDLKI
jgi:trigger factor